MSIPGLGLLMGKVKLVDRFGRVRELSCSACKARIPEINRYFGTKLFQEQQELQQLIRLVFFLEARKISLDFWKKPNLAEKLSDDSPLVRWVAANIIARKRIPAEKELVELLNDPFPEIREAAHQALVRLARGTDFGPHPLDSQAKIKKAIQRWNDWLALQEYRAAGAAEPSLDPLDPKSPSIKKNKK